VGPTAGLDAVVRKNPSPCPGYLTHSIVTILTELPQFLLVSDSLTMLDEMFCVTFLT
jgi:hypothetical protein